MPGSKPPSAKKVALVEKFNTYLDTYKTIVVAQADNVKSQQLHDARKSLRVIGAQMLGGKNTIFRRALKDRVKADPSDANQQFVDVLMPLLKFNVVMVFSNDKAQETFTVLKDNRVQAPAKAGSIAPMDVWVPAMNTGLEPTKTQIFQQLNIPTKIVKQSVEILKDVHLLKKDTKVGASEAGLLVMLNIRPFHYGLDVLSIYEDGLVYGPQVLSITEDEFKTKLEAGIANVKALAAGANYTTAQTLPTAIQTALKELIALSVGCESFVPSKIGGLVSDIREGKVAAAAAPAAAAPAAKEEKKAAAPPPEEEEEDDDEMFGGMF